MRERPGACVQLRSATIKISAERVVFSRSLTAERVDLRSDAARLTVLESPDPKTADVELARAVDDEVRENFADRR
jgi:hypothetical protein